MDRGVSGHKLPPTSHHAVIASDSRTLSYVSSHNVTTTARATSSATVMAADSQSRLNASGRLVGAGGGGGGEEAGAVALGPGAGAAGSRQQGGLPAPPHHTYHADASNYSFITTSWPAMDNSEEEREGGGGSVLPSSPSPSPFPATSPALSPLHSTTTAFPGFIDVNNISFEEGLFPLLQGLDNDTNCVYVYNSSSANCFGGLNTTANSSLLTDGDPLSPAKYWALLLIIFPMFTVFGNSLVVMSVYKEKTLRTVTNYFIVSLAVADIMVAVLVMPLCIYTEVNNGYWGLGDAMCDTFVAMDVMCCTASILNLTAISVDRFIAVTQPIKYAKHKNSKRVYVTLALTWVVSIAISSPIALGMNYTERREQTPNMCTFYNSDFLIYSSMGSFYIPCLIMILLYWRIFRAIRLRARKAKMHRKAKSIDNKSMTNIIENKAHNAGTVGKTTSTDASATEDSCHKELLPAGNSAPGPSSHHHHHLGVSSGGVLARSPIAEETSFTNYNAKFSTTEDTADEDHVRQGTRLLKSATSDDNAHVIPNDKSTDFMLSATSDEGHGAQDARVKSTGYVAPSTVEIEATTTLPSPACPPELLSPPPRRPIMHLGFKNHAAKPVKVQQNNNKPKSSPKKSVTKFNFRMRHSKKKKDHRSMANRRERKATQTLAIVLGVFLLCWVPFFTINIINAICIRYNLFEKRPECDMDPMLFSFFVWLGYINSFLNPVIYTIFNIEFRRAFKKLLEKPCT